MFNNKKNGLTLALQLLLCVALLATQVLPATLAFAETVPGTTEEVIVPTQEVVTPTDPAPTDNGETVVTAAPTDTAAPVDTATPTALPTDTLAPVPTATEEIIPTDPVEEGWTRTDTMPMDVRDILTNLGFAEDLMIDRFTLQFTEDGEVVTEPTENAQIEITFHVSLPEGITAQIREGDWYVIQMPDTLALSGAQIITLTADDVEYARVELETGPLRVKFSDAAQGLETIEDSFTVQAAFLPDVYTPGEEVTLSLPNEEAAPVSFTMAAAEEDLTDAVEDILQDPSDIVAALLSGQGLVTGYTVGYLQDGNYTSTPTVDSTIEASLTLTLTQAIADAVAAGDTTYTITLPQAMSIASEQVLLLDLASGMFTSAVVGTDKTLTLTFADDVSTQVGQTATLDFTAAFDPSVVTAAGAYSHMRPL